MRKAENIIQNYIINPTRQDISTSTSQKCQLINAKPRLSLKRLARRIVSFKTIFSLLIKGFSVKPEFDLPGRLRLTAYQASSCSRWRDQQLSCKNNEITTSGCNLLEWIYLCNHWHIFSTAITRLAIWMNKRIIKKSWNYHSLKNISLEW